MRASGRFFGYVVWLLALTLELKVWAAQTLREQQHLFRDALGKEDKDYNPKIDFSKIPPAEPDTPLKFILSCERLFSPGQGPGGIASNLEPVRGIFNLMSITGPNFVELTEDTVCTRHFVPYCQVVSSVHIKELLSQKDARSYISKLVEIGCATSIWGWNGAEFKDFEALRVLPMRTIKHWVNFSPDVLKDLLMEQQIYGDMPTPVSNSKFFLANLLKHKGFSNSHDLAWSVIDTSIIKVAAKREFGVATEMADYLLGLLDTRRATLEQLVVLMRMEYFMNALLTETNEYDVKTKEEILTNLNNARHRLFTATEAPEVRSLLAHPAPSSVSNFQAFVHFLSDEGTHQPHETSSDGETSDEIEGFKSTEKIIPFLVCPYESFLDETRFVLKSSLATPERLSSKGAYYLGELSSSESNSYEERDPQSKSSHASGSSDSSSSDHSEDPSNGRGESSRIKAVNNSQIPEEDTKRTPAIPYLTLDDMIRLAKAKVQLGELENLAVYRDVQESWLAEYVLLYPVELSSHENIVRRALKKSLEALKAYLVVEASHEADLHNPPRTIFSWCSMLLISGLDKKFGCTEEVSAIFDMYSPALRSNILQSLVADRSLMPAIFALCKTPDDLHTLSMVPYSVGKKETPRMVYVNSMVESLRNIDPRYLVDQNFFVTMVRPHPVADTGGVGRWAGDFAAVVMMGDRNTAMKQNIKTQARDTRGTKPIIGLQELHSSSESDTDKDPQPTNIDDIEVESSSTGDQSSRQEGSPKPEQTAVDDEDPHRLGFFQPGQEGYHPSWRLSRNVARHIGGVLTLMFREHSKLPYYVEEGFFALLMAPTRSNIWEYFTRTYKNQLQDLSNTFGHANISEEDYNEMVLEYLAVRRPSCLTFTDFDGVANELRVTGHANPRELLSKKRLAYRNIERLLKRFTKVIFKEFEAVILNIVDIMGLGMRIQAFPFVPDRTLLATMANFENVNIDEFLPNIGWKNPILKDGLIPSLIPGRMITVGEAFEAILRSFTLAQFNRFIRLWAGSYKLTGLSVQIQNPAIMEKRTIYFLGFGEASKAEEIKQEEVAAFSRTSSLEGDGDRNLINTDGKRASEYDIEGVTKRMGQLTIKPSLPKSSREGRVETVKTRRVANPIRGLKVLTEDDEEDSGEKSEDNRVSSQESDESVEENTGGQGIHEDSDDEELLSSSEGKSKELGDSERKAKKLDITYSSTFTLDHNAYRALVKGVALETIKLKEWDTDPASAEANPFLTGTYSDGEASSVHATTCWHTLDLPAGPTQAAMVQSVAIFLCESLNKFYDGPGGTETATQPVRPGTPTPHNTDGSGNEMAVEMEETNVDRTTNNPTEDQSFGEDDQTV